ncbi:MAG: cadherin-like domain-containing protein [Bacillota bacterium]
MNRNRFGFRRRPSRLLGALLVALLSVVLAPSALSAENLDQQQELINGSVSVPGGFRQSQTFTAGADGVLSRLSVHVANSLSAVNLVAELQGVTAAGEPDGAVLASTALSLSSPSGARWVDISFPQPPAVVTGRAYAIVLRPDNTFAWSRATTAPYTGGQAWTGADSWWTESGDYTFRTYVSEANAAPVAHGDAYEVDQGALLTVAAPGVLANDTDAEGQSLTAAVVHLPAYGTLSLQADGAFTYQPDAHFSGSDSFTYKAYDGSHYSEPVTVALTIHPVSTAPEETAPAPGPGNGGKVTGGGWLHDGEGKGHFAFTVASHKDGQLRGNAGYGFTGAEGQKYRVRVTGWLALNTDPEAATADFSGQAVVEELGEAVVVYEGYTMTFAWAGDSLSILIRDQSGAVWHQASGPLGGGQVKVHRPQKKGHPLTGAIYSDYPSIHS